MSKKAKKPAVSWTCPSRVEAIETLTGMAAEASDWHWSFGDLMLLLIPIGKTDCAYRYVDANGKGKRHPTLKAAYGMLRRHTEIKVNYELALTLRSTAAAWPQADRPDPALMSIYACQRLNGRRADTGAAGLAAMQEWIDDAIREHGDKPGTAVTVKAAEKRADDTNTSVVVPVEPKPKPKPKPDPTKPFTGPTAWADYCSALEALRKRQPRSALPDDDTGDRLTAAASAIVAVVPERVLTDVPN